MVPPFSRTPLAWLICCAFAATTPSHAGTTPFIDESAPSEPPPILSQSSSSDLSTADQEIILSTESSGKTGERSRQTQPDTNSGDFDPATPFASRLALNDTPAPAPAPAPQTVTTDDRAPIALPSLPTRRDPETGLRVEQSITLPDKSGSGSRSLPAFLKADQIDGLNEQEMVSEGNVELRKGGAVLTADRLTYWPIEDEAEASGNVVLTKNEDEIRGPRARLKIEDQIGFFENPQYKLKRAPVISNVNMFEGQSSFSTITSPPEVRNITEAHGQAERIDLEGENQVRLTNATYSTCKVGQTDWWAQAREIKLDYDREIGEAIDSQVMFLGVPIFYFPWMTFSLNNQRQSGLLAPTFGKTSKGGLELTVPYYWNIAPNLDATIAPRILSKRGIQLNTEFRYLMPTYIGQARLEYLPSDRNRKQRDDRYGYSFEHQQYLLPGLSASINYNGVSDDLYYTDLSSRITSTSQTQLLREGRLSYNPGTWFDANAAISSYQTLRPGPEWAHIESPYKMLPQVNFNAYKYNVLHSDWMLYAQSTRFTHGWKTDGNRWLAYPQVSLPVINPGWYITPKAGLHLTRYDLNRQNPIYDSQITRSVPVLSLDSGLTFERTINLFNRETIQTLEPRLYYLYVPYRNQEAIPLFDTGIADFDFAQAFSENRFTGHDRINDANQITFGLTSRLLDPNSGGEIIKAMIGQRYYFETPRVTLYPDSDSNSKLTTPKSSDLLAAFSGQIMPHVTATTAWQYNVNDKRTQRFAIGGRYQPAYGKVFNINYRLDRDSIKQIDLSGQWPIYRGWHGVARYNYDFLGNRLIEGIGGLEYNAGCWVARFVVQRFEATAGSPSTSVFVQLELNDFSRIGSNPLDILRRSIQGYGTINQPTADPIFGAN